MPSSFSPYISCKVPDGESGLWKVKTITIENVKDMTYLEDMSCLNSYKILLKEDKIVMSSAPADVIELKELYENAKGSVLLTGLGLGCAIQLIIDKPEVKDITVLEKEQDVINLVAPTFADERVKIIHADAFEWIAPEGKTYDLVFLDIFNSKDEINPQDIERLKNKYELISKSCILNLQIENKKIYSEFFI